jgi:phage tail-like protein
MAQTINQFPLTKFYFSVDWGEAPMSFQEVTGLELTREVAEYRGGLDTAFIKQCIPAMKTFGELTLKRGTFAGNSDFFDWWNGTSDDAAGDGMPARRDVTINLKNSAGDNVVTWKIDRALPTKLTSTDLNAENNEIAVETLVLRHEGIRISV